MGDSRCGRDGLREGVDGAELDRAVATALICSQAAGANYGTRTRTPPPTARTAGTGAAPPWLVQARTSCMRVGRRMRGGEGRWNGLIAM